MSDLPQSEPITPSPSVEGVPRASRWPRRIGCAGVAGVILLIAALFLPDGRRAREAARRSQCKNNLKQIGLALHNYHETYGSFPPAWIADDKGRPMHSWRVLILPQLDQQPLYDEYRFDEPWDGPHNSRLADRVLSVYRCPSDGSNSPTMTTYVAVIGPDTAFPGAAPTRIADYTDGPSNTIQIVEVANSGIHWMEPRDLHLSQMATTVNAKAGQGISSEHLGGAHVLFGDGGVRFVGDGRPAAEVRAMLTRTGGEPAPGF